MISAIERALQKEVIFKYLNDTAKNSVENVVVYKTIDSTNVEAKRILSSKIKPIKDLLLVSEHQSAGKGRLGRNFYSPPSTGIYMSLIYHDNDTDCKTDSVAITVTAAVAVYKSLKSIGVEAKIKWVNDLYVERKKVCGILTEGVLAGSRVDAYVIGIGINIVETAEGFPDDIKNIAGSINKDIDRNELVANIVNNLYDCLQKDSSNLMSEYRANSLVIGEVVTVIKPTETFPAKVLEITDEAHLIIEKEDGSTEELLSGEISIRV